jgi:hypothetical protein
VYPDNDGLGGKVGAGKGSVGFVGRVGLDGSVVIVGI